MTDRRTKLLHVIARFGVGGFGRQETELIMRLPPERCDQLVVTMATEGPFLKDN